MWDVVGCVNHLDGACEGGEVCDFDIGEESVQEKRLSALFTFLTIPYFRIHGLFFPLGWDDSLGFELIGKNQVCIRQQGLVRRHDILRYI